MPAFFKNNLMVWAMPLEARDQSIESISTFHSHTTQATQCYTILLRLAFVQTEEQE